MSLQLLPLSPTLPHVGEGAHRVRARSPQTGSSPLPPTWGRVRRGVSLLRPRRFRVLPPARRRGGRNARGGRGSPSAAGSRKRLIQWAQWASVPISTSAPQMPVISSMCSGFMIAEVMPAPIAIDEERLVEAVAVGQAEADVGGAAGRVDLQLLAQAADEAERGAAGVAQRADRHDQRIDDDVAVMDAVIRGALDDLLRDGEAHVGIFRDAGLVVGDRDDGGAILLHQRQHDFEPLFLAGHRIHQRPALVDGKAGFERGDDRAVDRERHVGQRLHELDRLRPGCAARRPSGCRH